MQSKSAIDSNEYSSSLLLDHDKTNNLHNTNFKRFIGFLKYSLFNSLSLIANTGIASILYYDNFSIAISSFVGILAGLLLNYFLTKDFVFRS